jgi:hypothetical protein
MSPIKSKTKQEGISDARQTGRAGSKAGAKPADGSGQVRAHGSGCTTSGFHLLVNDLGSVSLLNAALSGMEMKEFDKKLVALVQNKTDLLQCIDDMYLIVKAQPKYKKLNDDKFKAGTPPIVVLQWLIRKLAILANGKEWTVDTYMQGKKRRFLFVIYDYYRSQDVTTNNRHIPLDFLPNIKKKDPLFHDLIIETVAMNSRWNKIPLWDEDGEYSKILNQLLKEKAKPVEYKNLGITEMSVTQRMQLLYSKGPAAEYLALIKKRRKEANTLTVSTLFQKWFHSKKELSQRECYLKSMFRQAYEAAQTKEDIRKFQYVPEYRGKHQHYVAYDRYKYIWSNHNNDYLYKMHDKYEKYGGTEYLPVMFEKIYPGKAIKGWKDNDYPEILCGLFKTMYSCFVSGSHVFYYYKNQMKEQLTPGEQLLAKIESSTLKSK